MSKKAISIATVFVLVSMVTIVAAIMVIKTQWGIRSELRVLGDELKVCQVDGTECTSIDWGNMTLGASATHDIIVKNTGDDHLNLLMNSTLDTSVGSVTWNYTGAALLVGELMPIQLTVTINSTASRDTYMFDINIYGWRGS